MITTDTITIITITTITTAMTTTAIATRRSDHLEVEGRAHHSQ
jgi:hypothetical protein